MIRLFPILKPHGRAWKIHDKEALVKEVIPKYFVQTKYESFTRQLNGWGLKRLHQSGNDYNAYYHECLLRGLPKLTMLMRRAERNKGKLMPHVEGEPNFYEIARQYPLPYHHLGGQYGQHSHPPYMQAMAGHDTDAAYMSHPPAGYPPSPHPYYPTQQYLEPTMAHEPHPWHQVTHPIGPSPQSHLNWDTPYDYRTYGHPPQPPHYGVPLQCNLSGLNDIEGPPLLSNYTANPAASEKVPLAPGAASARDDEWAVISDSSRGK